MKIRGELTLVFRDVETGEITKTVQGLNHLQNHFLEDLAEGGSIGTGQQIGQVLFVSDTNPGKQSRDWPANIPSVREGTDIAGVDRVTITLNYAPGIHLGQYVQRFAPPAADYTINIAGLCQSVSVQDVATNADTVVWLETPCVQTTTETLDLYYRVQLLFEDDWSVFATNDFNLNPYDSALLAQFLFAESGSYPLPNTTNAFGYNFSKYNGRQLAEPNAAFGSTYQGIGGTGATFTAEQGRAYYVRRGTFSRDIQTSIGRLVGYIGTYIAGKVGLLQKILPTGLSSLQSVFGHRDTSDTPFYNSANAQLGLGTLTVNADSWTDPDFPKYIRMDITTTGLLGVGAYKFRVRNHFGYIDNTFTPNPAPLFFTQQNQTHWYNDGWTWAKGRTPDTWVSNGGTAYAAARCSHVVPYDLANNKVVVFDDVSFGVCDFIDGSGQAFTDATLVGADVLPRFQPTDLSQVAVASNGDIYLSCRDTGLYHFNAALDTLTIIDSSTTGLTGVTGCKAVCIGNAGRLWAYWGHATTPDIYYSDDGGSSWTPAGYSDVFVDANPDLVFNIQADVNDAGGKLALIHYDQDESVDANGIQDILVKWWDHALTTASDGPQVSSLIRTQQYSAIPFDFGCNYLLDGIVTCSPNNSFWGCAGYRGTNSYGSHGHPTYLTFGSATVTPFANTTDTGNYMHNTSWEPDAAGNDAMIVLTDRGQDFGEQTFAHHVILASQDGTFENQDASGNGLTLDSAWIHRYLKDGIFLGCFNSAAEFEQHNYHNIYFLHDGSPDTALFDALPGLSNICYPEYGWNGSAWEKGHAGSKPLHAAAEELIDGVTVAWDDAGGTNQFLDSDHYTFGLFDGIWLDGSTQFDFRWDLFAKPSTANTEVEAATLPATTKVANILLDFFPDDFATEWQDGVSTTTSLGIGSDNRLIATGTGLQGDYSAGARSVNLAIDGTAQSFLPNQTFIPGTDTNNCQGFVEYTIYHPNSIELEAYYGVSPAGVLGSPLSAAGIGFAWHFDSVTPGAGPGTCRMRVVEGGVERATMDTVPYGTSDEIKVRIALLTNGSMQYSYNKKAEGAWVVLYESPPGSVTIQNLHFDCAYVPYSSYGIEHLSFHPLDTSSADYYLYLGDGIDQGVFHPWFQSIDPESVTVWINGVEAVNVGANDTVTVLPANSYSPYPTSGVIRYSADDVGKTVSAEYVTVHHE